jgi:hypothetical protein
MRTTWGLGDLVLAIRRRDAHERPGVPGVRPEADGDPIALRDEVVDDHPVVGQPAVDAVDRLLQGSAPGWHRPPAVGHEVLGHQLVDRRLVAAEHLVDEPARDFLVGFEGHPDTSM